jgi:hypothetical protein
VPIPIPIKIKTETVFKVLAVNKRFTVSDLDMSILVLKGSTNIYQCQMVTIGNYLEINWCKVICSHYDQVVKDLINIV